MSPFKVKSQIVNMSYLIWLDHHSSGDMHAYSQLLVHPQSLCAPSLALNTSSVQSIPLFCACVFRRYKFEFFCFCVTIFFLLFNIIICFFSTLNIFFSLFILLNTNKAVAVATTTTTTIQRLVFDSYRKVLKNHKFSVVL